MVELATLQAVSYIMGSLGVFVAAVYYVLNIQNNRRNQELTLKALEQSAKAQELTLKAYEQNLETRQAQLFMGIFQSLYSRDFGEAVYLLDHTEVKDFEDYKRLMDNQDFQNAFDTFHVYYEGIGILVKEGLVDIRLVAQLMSGPVRWFWERYRPIVDEARREYRWPRMMIEVEYLYNALNEYAESHPELQIASPKY